MQFTTIQNLSGFFETIGACSGDVSFIDRDGNRRSLKAVAEQMAAFGCHFEDGCLRDLEVVAVQPEDRCRLINYMAETGRSRSLF